jgi:hypothetical protein
VTSSNEAISCTSASFQVSGGPAVQWGEGITDGEPSCYEEYGFGTPGAGYFHNVVLGCGPGIT